MATSIKIDNQLRNRIQHLADIQHRSTHWLILQAIKEYVERGYVALYCYDASLDTVYILAFRHQKEAGYTNQKQFSQNLNNIYRL